MRKKLTDDATLAAKFKLDAAQLAEAAELTGDDPPSNEPPPDFNNAGTMSGPDSVRSIGTLAKRWVWIVGMKRFVRRSDGETWDREQFDSNFNALTDLASVSKLLFKKPDLLRKFETRVYRPNAPEFGEGGSYYNVWKPSLIVPKEGDTSLWDEHLLFLLPDDERKRLLDWMAWVYQNPRQRPGRFLLLIGETKGTGKSFVCRVMEHLIGKANTQRPANASLTGQFNEWAGQCKLAIFEELNQTGRREAVNKLQELITEERVEVNIKFVRPFLAENYMAMMGTSNHIDAVPIDEGDRRWEPIVSPVTQAEKDAAELDGHFRRLMPIVQRPDNEALAAIAYQLKTRDVTGFIPGSAPVTATKAGMIELGAKPLDRWMADNINNPPFTRRLVNIDDDILPLVPAHVMRDQTTRSAGAMVAKFLKRKCEGVAIGKHRTGIGRKSRVVALYALNDLGVEAKLRIERTGCEPRHALGKLNVTEAYRLECDGVADDQRAAHAQQAYDDFSADPYEE